MMLDITDRRILIIGGGSVASRKARGVMAAGARRIRVIASEFRAAFPEQVERITRPYNSGDLTDADLVFAATDSAVVNDAVVRDARTAGILVCRADGSEETPGDFSTPAKFQSGSISVTVSANSAALAAAIRDSLRESFDPQWTAMADAMQTLRPIIKAAIEDADQRARIFRELATPAARLVLRESGIDGLKNWILTRQPHTL